MPSAEYSKARKRAQKTYRQDISSGKHPYLEILDELLPFIETVGESDLGLIEIPIERIVGTKSAGRTRAFASNFMPLLKEDTEFADKWSTLYEAHISEGIREPVIACELYNSYYIIEGNKRVSVLKYSGAVTVSGYVTRIIPAPNDSRESRVYYEYMDFCQATGINSIYFSKPGSFHELCRLVGKEFGEPWDEDERRLFSSCLLCFTDSYREKGGERIPVPVGDALLVYLNVYGYEGMAEKNRDVLKKELTPLWNDLEALPFEKNVSVVMQPEAGREPEPEKALHLLQKLILPASPKLSVAFLYYKTAETSSWTYSHDLGRHYLEDNLSDRLSIRVYDEIRTDDECFAAIERAIGDGCSVIFTTSPRFLGPSIRAGMKYPDIKLLNCSLNAYSGHLRTYYGRLYEAKFLVGMLAGILTHTDQIGYIADFPIFGATANVNAFALGVKMVNPAAKIHLVWSTEKDCDVMKILTDAHVSHISGRDMLAPLHSSRRYGLYDLSDPKGRNLAASIWHWGKFYQRILQTILNGKWKRNAPAAPSINYWWGISSGMIDLIASKTIPERTLQLVELMKKQIVSGEFQIFSGELFDQAGTQRNAGGGTLTPEEIIRMDWLLDNVIGHIPSIDMLVDEAIPMMEIQEIYSNRDEF